MNESVEKTTVSAIWWPTITVAVITILFGLAALFWPGMTVVTLVYLVGIFLVIHGITRFVGGLLSVRTMRNWWAVSLLGLVGLGVGIFILSNVNLALATFILVVGLVLITQGILEIIAAMTDNTVTENSSNESSRALRWVVGLAGILAGILILLQPAALGIAFIWILGLYAVIAGTLELIVALEFRSTTRHQIVHN